MVKSQLSFYRKVFDTEYNLAFHTPVKDRCDFCVSVENTRNIQPELQREFESHIFNKEKARENKNEDKVLALKHNDLVVACFDLEEVLLTPHSNESCLYYKRRLCTFNFTVYEFGFKEGYCYVWNETIASRGACESSSCLFDFIKIKSKEGKKNIFLFR